MLDSPTIKNISAIDDFPLKYIHLFKDVFNADTSIDFFKWKFSETEHFLLAGLENNKIVSFYGLTPRTFSFQDQLFSGVQPCDVMVSPSFRGSLTGSLFQRMLNGYKQYLENNDTNYVFLFGFPHQRHMKLGERLSGYSLGDNFQWLEWNNESEYDDSQHCQLREITATEIAEIHTLWQAMKSSMNDHSVGIRDDDYIAYRYVNHPQFQYQAIRVSDNTNKLTGYIIFKSINRQRFIMDVIAAKPDIGKVCNTVAIYLLQTQDVIKVRIAISTHFSKLITDANACIHIAEHSPIAIGNLVEKYWDNTQDIYQRLLNNVFLTLGDQESN